MSQRELPDPMKITAHISIVLLVVGLGIGAAVRAQAPQATMHVPANDAEYVEMMAMHHDQGIQMAEIATRKAADAGVKQLATRIVDAQRKERKELDALRAKATGKPGPAHSMKPMPMDHLDKSSGREFDRMFLSMMRDHHRDAVKMSREAKLTAASVKDFARRTVASQGKEIKEMDAMLKRIG